MTESCVNSSDLPSAAKTMRGRICMSIGVKDLDEALRIAQHASACADVIEVRLDLLKSPSISPFMSAGHRPLLFTNRAAWEGGGWQKSETERIDLLVEAVTRNAAYVDLELRAGQKARDALTVAKNGSPTQLIVSYHDFAGTPDSKTLASIVDEMHAAQADIGKIITTANTAGDILRVLQLLDRAKELNFPLIAFCMGKIGMISRLTSVVLGGFMTYCAPDGQQGTAPGQLTVSEMRVLLDRFL